MPPCRSFGGTDLVEARYERRRWPTADPVPLAQPSCGDRPSTRVRRRDRRQPPVQSGPATARNGAFGPFRSFHRRRGRPMSFEGPRTARPAGAPRASAERTPRSPDGVDRRAVDVDASASRAATPPSEVPISTSRPTLNRRQDPEAALRASCRPRSIVAAPSVRGLARGDGEVAGVSDLILRAERAPLDADATARSASCPVACPAPAR